VGRLSYKDEFKLSFKTSGKIESIEVKSGSYVRKNQILATLNTDEIQTKVAQTEYLLIKSKRDFERVQNLFRDSVATLEQLQNTQTQLDVAQKDYDTAIHNLENTIIKAPGSGVIQTILYKENEVVGAGSPVFVFGSVKSKMVLTTSLSDIDAMKIALKDSALIKFDAIPNLSFHGLVVEKEGMADPYTGTFEVEVQIDDPLNKLVPGLIGNIRIYSSEQRDFLVIPISALLYADRNTGKVYVKQGSKAQLHEVKIEEVYQDKILISEGLDANDLVILEGHRQFSGDTVNLK
jgi:RND family efflux transporter MFP subunit